MDRELKMKIVVMGLCGAGMTNIVNRYALGRYDDCSYATTGSNYARKIIKIKNEPVVLDIWDTPGSEKYRSLVKFFYKDTDALILVYDITWGERFKEFKSYVTYDVLKNAPPEVSKKKSIYNFKFSNWFGRK